MNRVARLKSTFNRTNDNVEWASWTWNPVTGCKHGCPYCYARDIARRFYGNGGFEPKFHPARLAAPALTPAPRPNAPIGDRNVFVCSMADRFPARTLYTLPLPMSPTYARISGKDLVWWLKRTGAQQQEGKHHAV